MLMVSFTDEELEQFSAAAGDQAVPAFIRDLAFQALARRAKSPSRKA